ncbi:MAG: class I SAM-dependent methyltransferase [candidate division WOR-3 bacterium]
MTIKNMDKILKEIEEFYRKRFSEFGPTAEGVGWKDEEAQRMRHQALLEGIRPADKQRPITVHEIGCGVGHMLDLIKELGLPYTYSGSDASEAYLAEARKRHPGVEFTRFNFITDPPPGKYDYVFLSGSFNYLPPSAGWDGWRDIVFDVINKMWDMCLLGIGFNLLTDAVDWRDPDLFYISPCEIIEHLRKLSRLFLIRHDYYPFEFSAFAYREKG